MLYQLDSNVDSRPKRGPDVKVIIQSLKTNAGPLDFQRTVACNPAKMFKSLIQRANDSGSMDTSLEYKSLCIDRTPQRTVPYVDELREILKENQHRTKLSLTDSCGTPTKMPFTNRKNLPDASTNTPKNDVKVACDKCDTKILNKKMPASSTPYRPKHDHENNNNCERECNLMTPTTDVRSIEFDSYDDKTLVKCFSLTRASCRRMASLRKSSKKPNDETSPIFERRSLFTSSFNASNRSSIIGPTELSPLRRQTNIKVKNNKIFNFFRSSKTGRTSPRPESDLTQTCNDLTQLLDKSNQNLDELGCVPLLTKDNIDLYTSTGADCDKTIDWGNNFEFSYICEPSTSDIDEDNEYSSKNESQPNIPHVHISPPSTGCGQTINESVICDLASSPFRRSVSDPALVRLASTHNFDHNTNHPSDINNTTRYIVSGFCYS